jgi:hypothetical protein
MRTSNGHCETGSTVAILSVNEYQRLRHGHRQALRVDALDGATLAALATAAPRQRPGNTTMT